MSRYTLTGGAEAKWLGVSPEVQSVKRCSAQRDGIRNVELRGRCSYTAKHIVDGKGYCNVHVEKARSEVKRGS